MAGVDVEAERPLFVQTAEKKVFNVEKNSLSTGGNAIDAAIATNIVQGVVAPETCGIGGDLFALIWING